jgi:ATP:corrinoid adenosyltransferase
MKVINLFGSSGSGKSTTALGLAYRLKLLGYKVEYVSEYIKEYVFSGTLSECKYQNKIFGNRN